MQAAHKIHLPNKLWIEFCLTTVWLPLRHAV